MTVTFTPVIEPDAYKVTDGCGGEEPAATEEAAWARVAELVADPRPLPGCTDPELVLEYRAYLAEPVVTGLDVPAVNVTDTNARHLLGLLGALAGTTAAEITSGPELSVTAAARHYRGDTDFSGQADAQDFLGRVLMALAGLDDAGIPAYTNASGRQTTCGRTARYTTRRLLDLHHLAQWSIRTGARTITWG